VQSQWKLDARGVNTFIFKRLEDMTFFLPGAGLSNESDSPFSVIVVEKLEPDIVKII
jgi:hypothetical protein